MELIHIYGAAGSGTTTLGRALSGALGWRHLDTGDESMGSKAMHDAWAEQLTCQRLTLDGRRTVEELTDAVNRVFSKNPVAE